MIEGFNLECFTLKQVDVGVGYALLARVFAGLRNWAKVIADATTFGRVLRHQSCRGGVLIVRRWALVLLTVLPNLLKLLSGSSKSAALLRSMYLIRIFGVRVQG